MRQYLIDELSFLERDNLDSFLKRTLKPAGIEGAFFLEIPEDLLTKEQIEHEQCKPFYSSVILDKDSIRFEFLIRSGAQLRCSCIDWANKKQRKFIMDFADKMIEEEFIKV